MPQPDAMTEVVHILVVTMQLLVIMT